MPDNYDPKCARCHPIGGPRPYHIATHNQNPFEGAPLLKQTQGFKEHDDVTPYFRDRYEAKLLGRERDGVVVEFTCKVTGHKMKRWLSPQQEDRYKAMWENWQERDGVYLPPADWSAQEHAEAERLRNHVVKSVVDLRDLPLIDPIRGGELT